MYILNHIAIAYLFIHICSMHIKDVLKCNCNLINYICKVIVIQLITFQNKVLAK